MNAKEIIEGNKLIAEFMGLTARKNIADWSEYDDLCITDAIKGFMNHMVVVSKGSGLEWFLVRHRDKNIQLFTDGTYHKVKDEDVEVVFGKHPPDNLLYHTSWDWLMPVVEKCYALDEYYKYKDKTTSMFSEGGIELVTRIANVFEQVVEFIKWYNLQK